MLCLASAFGDYGPMLRTPCLAMAISIEYQCHTVHLLKNQSSRATVATAHKPLVRHGGLCMQMPRGFTHFALAGNSMAACPALCPFSAKTTTQRTALIVNAAKCSTHATVQSLLQSTASSAAHMLRYQFAEDIGNITPCFVAPDCSAEKPCPSDPKEDHR